MSAACVEAFGDRVSEWITINRTLVCSWLGYMSGVHAPGVKTLTPPLQPRTTPLWLTPKLFGLFTRPTPMLRLARL
jgi:hypothetical protein